MEVSSKITQIVSFYWNFSFLITFPVNILPTIESDFNYQMFMCVPLSPINAMDWESSENELCLNLLGISTGKCLIGWWEWRGEYNMLSFYSKTVKNLPSGLYSMCMIGVLWCLIYSTTDTFSISMILRVPDLNPAANNIAFGLPEIQRQGSLGG